MLKDFTIDGPESLDLDDTIREVKRLDSGWEVVVGVTNTTKLIKIGMSSDVKARERVETRYHSRGHFSMLPPYKERLLSLLQGKKRSVLCVRVRLDEQLNLSENPKIWFDTFKNKCRLSYPDIPGIIDDPSSRGHSTIKLCADLSLSLLEKRRQAGAFVVYDTNAGWVTNEEGFLVRLARREDTIGYIIIQELMILANSAMATHCALNDIPVLYRNHTAKAHAPERNDLLESLASIGGSTPARLDTLRSKLHMVLNKATVEPVLRGHYGLNLPAYLWGTSPIRRYADMVNQRQISAWVKAKKDEVPPEYPYSTEDLVELGEHITTWKNDQKDRTRAHFKTQAKKQAEHALSSKVLFDLPGKEFDRAVKLAAAMAEPPEGFSEGCLGRLSAARVSALALYRLLIETAPGDSWAPLREATLGHLEGNPHLATSLLNVATSIQGWKEVQYVERRSGPGHALIFSVRAVSGSYQGDEASGPNLKRQKQRAVIRLLSEISGGAIPEVVAETRPTKASKKSSPDLPRTTVDNPIAALQEYGMQSIPQMTPSYTFVRIGEAHTPAYECTATFGNVSVDITMSGKKKLSKAAAARALIQALRN